MKFNKYLLVAVDYDSETLEVHSLKDDDVDSDFKGKRKKKKT